MDLDIQVSTIRVQATVVSGIIELCYKDLLVLPGPLFSNINNKFA